MDSSYRVEIAPNADSFLMIKKAMTTKNAHSNTQKSHRPQRQRWWVRVIVGYLVVVGFATHIAGVGGLMWTLRHFDLTPHQLTMKVVAKSGLDYPWLTALLRPKPWYPDQPLDGQIRQSHPRILMPELANWDGRGQPAVMQRRLELYHAQGIALNRYPVCGGQATLQRTVCWLTTGNAEAGQQAVAQLTSFSLQTPKASGDYGNLWQLALAYDLLARHPNVTPALAHQVETKIFKSVQDYLLLLDSDGPSLWHGRSSLAALAWLGAIVLTPGVNAQWDDVIRRAQAHFSQTIQALTLAEAWPEGYNYWINTRAFILSLAAGAYLNGLENSQQADQVRQALMRVGLWTIYTTRPDHRIVQLGDEGPRIDLKDETRRVIDLIGQLTREPVFATYSRYLEQVHGTESYYRGYRWQFRLLNDPTVAPLPDVPVGTLQGLAHWLPRAELFGPWGSNLFVARTGWGAQDTLLTMQAGSTLTHHGHYGAGHFTLFKGAPLAITNAIYSGNIRTPHRLYYGLRTVSKNSLLILRPDEHIKPSRLVTENVIDGGQRVVIPTGSAIRSVDDWLNNLRAGRHFEGGQTVTSQLRHPRFAYIKVDLTPAYDNTDYDSQHDDGKVKRVWRQLLYLFDEDRVILCDDIEAVRPSYTKKWLLHTPQRPEVPSATVLVGTQQAGILQSATDHIVVNNGSGRLDIKRLLPQNAVVRLVGGPGFEYYVETDGDDHVLNGRNFADGAILKPWFDAGQWRIEIQPDVERPA
jgi:hypothetical protein